MRKIVMLIVSIFALTTGIFPVSAQENSAITSSKTISWSDVCGPDMLFMAPVPSPDGTKLAFLHFNGLKDFEHQMSLQVLDLKNNILEMLRDTNVTWATPSWLDNETVLYLTQREERLTPYLATTFTEQYPASSLEPSEYSFTNTYIMSVNIRTQGVKEVTAGQGRVAVHPNGKLLAFLRYGSRYYQVWFRDLETGEEWPLTEGSDPSALWKVSPAQAKTIFSEWVDNLSFRSNGMLYAEMFDYDKHSQTIITFGGPEILWVPIVSFSYMGEFYASRDPEAPSLVRENHDFSPDGQKLVYSMFKAGDYHRLAGSSNEYGKTPEWLVGNSGKPIFHDYLSWREHNPSWLNNQEIVFISDREENPETPWNERTYDIFISNADGTNLRQITCLDNHK